MHARSRGADSCRVGIGGDQQSRTVCAVAHWLLTFAAQPATLSATLLVALLAALLLALPDALFAAAAQMQRETPTSRAAAAQPLAAQPPAAGGAKIADAQATSDPRVYRLDRSEEDWSFLADPTQRGADPWDGWKYRALRRPGWFVSLGGEGRLFYERYREHLWGAGPQDRGGYTLGRVLAHADFHLGPRVRTFVELRSGMVGGRHGGPRPTDRDDLDIGQAWLGLSGGGHNRGGSSSSGERRDGRGGGGRSTRAARRWDVRIGRQELAYGEGALVAIRELNVRRPFDGVRGRLDVGPWRVDSFIMRPVATREGVFDDVRDSQQLFWGAYATRATRAHALRPSTLSLVAEWSVYYLGLRRAQALFDQGRGRDHRHTTGLALHLRTGPLAHALEGTFQWGTFEGDTIGRGTIAKDTGESGAGEKDAAERRNAVEGDAALTPSSGRAPIRAWKYSHGTSVAWRTAPLCPSAGLNLAISSGDRRADDPALQTFHPLFPKGLYYGHIDSSGSLNAIVLHPYVIVRPTASLTVQTDTFLFWRQQAGDGLYSQPGFLLRSGLGLPGRYVGWLQDAEVSLRADRHTTFHLLVTYYGVGTFLRDSKPPAKDDLYVGLKLSYRF